MYADDIQLYSVFDPKIPMDAECALHKLSVCVKDVKAWMVANKLQLNEGKTDLIIFGSSSRLKSVEHLSFHTNNAFINPSTSVRNLGVTFDNKMTMSAHVSQLCKSVNFHLRNIGKIRPYIDESTCHAVVRSLVLSRLDYCNSLLTVATKSNVNRLQKLQNKAAKLIFKKKRRDHVSPLLKELHWLPVSERVIFKTGLLTFKSLMHTSPKYISSRLQRYVPARALRSSSSNLLFIPRTNTRAGSGAFSCAAATVWNSLPSDVRHATSMGRFKRILKSHLFHRT